MKKYCVYTAIYGDYEILRENKISFDNTDFVCFTDNKELTSNTWKIIYRPIEGNVTSNVFYKRLKCLPHIFLSEYEYTIWLDANFIINNADAINYYMRECKSNKILLYRHFCLGGMHRKCILEEARFSWRNHEYRQEKMQDQVQQYFNVEKYPINNGLYQSGFLFRNNKDIDVINFNALWNAEILKWCTVKPQCQVSLPYCLWKSNIKFDVFANDIIWNTKFYDIYDHKHAKVIHKEICVVKELIK